ncbi:MAG: GFA family protein, partial [Myxococcales bacterium]|nr:GFA family protein [Myxococcales bacterium]
MCRRWSAGPFLAVHSDGPARFSRDEGLTWYRSSRWAERGFCSRCGASLFWRLANRPDTLAASVEALDAPERLALDRHIYIDAKPDRYDFADARPRVTEAELMAELGLSAP